MQDTVFTISALSESPKVAYIDSPLYFYCMRGDSAIHKYTPEFHKTAISVYNAIKEKLRICTYIKDVEDVLDYKAICLLIEIYRLEILHSGNKDRFHGKIDAMKRYSNIEPWKSAIHSRHCQYLNRKQRLFKKLEMLGLYRVIYCLLKLQSIAKRKS